MSAFNVRDREVNTMDDIRQIIAEATVEFDANGYSDLAAALYEAYGAWNSNLHPEKYPTWQDGAVGIRPTLDRMLPDHLRDRGDRFWGLIRPVRLLAPEEPLEDSGDPLQEAMKETL